MSARAGRCCGGGPGRAGVLGDGGGVVFADGALALGGVAFAAAASTQWTPLRFAAGVAGMGFGASSGVLRVAIVKAVS